MRSAGLIQEKRFADILDLGNSALEIKRFGKYDFKNL